MPDRAGGSGRSACTSGSSADRDAVAGERRPRRGPTAFGWPAMASRPAGAAGVGLSRLIVAEFHPRVLQRVQSGSLVRRGAGPLCGQEAGRRRLEHLRGHARRPNSPPDHQGPGKLPKSVLPGHALHARFSGALAPDHVRERPQSRVERMRLRTVDESLLLQARRLGLAATDLQSVQRRQPFPAWRRPADFHELATLHLGTRPVGLRRSVRREPRRNRLRAVRGRPGKTVQAHALRHHKGDGRVRGKQHGIWGRRRNTRLGDRPQTVAFVPADHSGFRRPLPLPCAAAGRQGPRLPPGGGRQRRLRRLPPGSRFGSVRDRLPRPSFPYRRGPTGLSAHEPDGRSSNVREEDASGKFYCLDVYCSDLRHPAEMARGTAKRLRVMEGVPRPIAFGEGLPTPPPRPSLARSETGHNRGTAQPMAPRRILGEVAVEEDGSFNIVVPANTPIQLQLLDDRGMALRSCAWIWAKNHESRGCIGCHEDGEWVPDNRFAQALGKASVVVAAGPRPATQSTRYPPGTPRRTPDFHRDVLPIVRDKCMDCHRNGQSPPYFAAAPNPAEAERTARQVYNQLLASGGSGTPQSATGNMSIRGRHGPARWRGIFSGRTRAGPGMPRARRRMETDSGLREACRAP